MSKSSSDPTTRRASSSCQSDGSSSAPSHGLDDAGVWPRIGKISIAEASHSCVSRRSGSCRESYAIQHDLSGQTLTKPFSAQSLIESLKKASAVYYLRLTAQLNR